MQSPLLVYLLSLQAVTFLVWGLDKWKAGRGSRRVSERTLLGLALLGGGVGAWAGVKLWRHKSSKGTFLWKLALVSPSVLFLTWWCYTLAD